MNRIALDTLGAVQQTLLIPLWARAMEAEKSAPILYDPYAAPIIKQLDYDFQKFRLAGLSQVGVCVRGHIFDCWLRAMLKEVPEAAVVELGVGLDTRFERMDNGSVKWFDVDLPEVMDLRRRFFEERERRAFIACPVERLDWIEQVKERAPGPYILLMEGVLPFFEPSVAENLLVELAEGFPNGRMCFDSVSPLFIRFQRLHDTLRHFSAEYRWPVRSCAQLENLSPLIDVEERRTYRHLPIDIQQKLTRPMRWFYHLPVIPCLYHFNRVRFKKPS